MIPSVTFGPNLVSPNESIFYVDAANPSSYPGSGNTWNDLSQYRASSSFYYTNGYQPTFDPSNFGSFTFSMGYPPPLGFYPSGSMLVREYNNATSNYNFETTLGLKFTVNAWVKVSERPNAADIGVIAAFRRFDYSGTPVQNIIFSMQCSNYLFTFLHFYRDGTPFPYPDGIVTASCAFSNYNTWYNVVGVRNEGTSSIYLNGIFQTSSAKPLGTPYVGPVIPYLTIGAQGFNTPDYVYFPYSGSIASVEIYNRILTNDEILQNFNAMRARFGI